MARKPRRIVLKFGTGILTSQRGKGLDQAQFRRLTAEVAAQIAAGRECLVVSSGSVGAGMMVLGLKERPTDLPSIQACAAVGQSQLMRMYQSLFSRHGLHVAQVLLTHQDMDSRTRYANARNTLDRLLRVGRVVPIINENDTVAVEELKYGDNDRLSAEVAIMAGADLLVLLTSVEGLLKETARGGKAVVPVVEDIARALPLVTGSVGRFSVGGMASKLQAVKMAVDAGIPAVIASGRLPGRIALAVDKFRGGTVFPVPATRR